MALTFRYRYVDFGTVFTGDSRLRGDSSTETPGILFANELATDVGGTCWGTNEPLAIIDHHFSGEGQFPSASAAVLHKAKLIRERFGKPPSDNLWLVSHKEPDFDAFCSMYLARWIIESSDAVVDWESYGLHPDSWLDLPQWPKVDWFNPDLTRVPAQLRWPLLLASYASALDSRRPIACPRQRQLNSVLLAALTRGRNYLSETSGATEFFAEVKRLLRPGDLNPLWDSVLESSTEFAPELAMLDLEAPAYDRDVLRARKAIVYLPEAEAPSPRFFKSPKEVALLEQQGNAQDVSAEHLLLADTFRIPTAGIYLRDPECRLFQQWARLDLKNAPLNSGFEFTAIAASNGRPAGLVNRADYAFSVDPERANGRHLFTVWSRLETKEVEALRMLREASVSDAPPARTSNQHSATLGTLLADPWFGGQSSYGTLVRTPARGTLIGPPGARNDLRDDPIVEEVRTELEGPVYSAESLVAGPQVMVVDKSASRHREDLAPRQLDLNAPLKIPPPPESYFRFATVRLRADVPIASQQVLDRQIGETLWQVLYPEMPGATPADFAERHLIITASAVGVWGDRGVAIAQKLPRSVEEAPQESQTFLQNEFADLVSLLRDVDGLRADVSSNVIAAPSANTAHRSVQNAADHTLKATVARAEELVVRAAKVEHALTLPSRDLLRHLADVIGVDQVFATLRDLSQTAAENLRRDRLAEQTQRIEANAAMIATARSRVEWLEVFSLGVLAIVLADVIAWQLNLASVVRHALLLLAGPLVIGLAASILKPWKRKPGAGANSKGASTVLMILVIACVAGWLAGLFMTWGR